MQKSRANFLAKSFFVAFREFQNVFQKQNNLRGHWIHFLIRKLCARESTQCIRRDSVCLQTRIRTRLESHRQFRRAFAQRFWQFFQSRLDFMDGRRA